jgi:hypothetical protein
MNADWTENRIGRRMPRGLYMLRPTANDFAPVFMDMEPSTGFTTYRLVIDRFSGDKRDMNVVYLGDRLVRWMHDSRLPDTIKSKLAMVEAMDNEWKKRVVPGHVRQPYVCPSPKLVDVGWRVSKDMYTVIIPEQTIVSLKGEPMSKETQE